MIFKLEPSNDELELMDDLTGRIIYFRGENFGLLDYDNRIVVDFYCGPETKEGYLLDISDCGIYKQLEKVFKDCGVYVDIGAAENYHEVLVSQEKTTDEVWNFIVKVLNESGAVEKLDETA